MQTAYVLKRNESSIYGYSEKIVFISFDKEKLEKIEKEFNDVISGNEQFYEFPQDVPMMWIENYEFI